MFLLANSDDPNFRCRQTSHRDFMTTQSRLVEVVSFRNYVDLFNLIVFTYRLDYVRESVLFPYLNDNSFRVTSQVPVRETR